MYAPQTIRVYRNRGSPGLGVGARCDARGEGGTGSRKDRVETNSNWSSGDRPTDVGRADYVASLSCSYMRERTFTRDEKKRKKKRKVHDGS